MRVRLRTRVPIDDAVFYFAGGDHALPGALAVCAAYCREQPDGPVQIDLNNIPWGILPALADLFTEACVGWEKVTDEDTGEAILFSRQARDEFPPEYKAMVAAQFLEERQKLLGEANRPVGLDTPTEPGAPTSAS